MKKYITLEDIRKIQLDILRNVHNFCIKNNIRYSLGGGTLLGAIKHKGYIPWDDDIDIMMPRPDYERFLHTFNYDNLNIIDYKRCETYFKPFAKVYDCRTVLEEENDINGIYIDIFPIEGLPDPTKWKKYFEDYSALALKLWKLTKYPNYEKRPYGKIKYIINKIFLPKREVVIKQIENLLSNNPYDEAEYCGVITGRYAEKEFMNAQTFHNYILLPFEGEKFMAISGYDAYLTKHYGNYMQLPPKELQISNHQYIAYWK